MANLKDLIRKLLHIEETAERTALAYSIGVFLGFSPFLGFHTLGGIAIAFLFKLNRVAILLGIWSNTPWFVIPYYTIATWVGMRLTGFEMDRASLTNFFHTGMEQGFLKAGVWKHLASQWEILLPFTVGSMLLSTVLGFAAYPLSLRGIKFYRSRRSP